MECFVLIADLEGHSVLTYLPSFSPVLALSTKSLQVSPMDRFSFKRVREDL